VGVGGGGCGEKRLFSDPLDIIREDQDFMVAMIVFGRKIGHTGLVIFDGLHGMPLKL